uniref:Neuropeptide Y receptor n=1 Tax=Magallana gigas TaxID=29159 RepID=K1Q379_MAGGI
MTVDKMRAVKHIFYKCLLSTNPRSLIHTIWLNNSLHFGLRSREEHVQLRWGDLELKKTSTKGEEYLEHTERVTKSRTVMTRNVRPFGARMFVDPVVAIVGNVIVCYIIVREKMLRSVTNIFLLNIAVADITKTIILVPFSFVPNLLLSYWPFGNFMCPFVLYAEIVVVLASAFTLVAMSADRYVAIIYPLRPRLTHKGVACVCGLVWVIALLVPIPTAVSAKVQIPFANFTGICQKGMCFEDTKEPFKSTYSLLIMLLQYFIPLLVLALTYCHIGYVIWIKIIPGEAVQQQDERQASSKRKVK